MDYRLIICSLLLLGLRAVNCANPGAKSRINCFPEKVAQKPGDWQLTKEQCEERGCTFDTDTGGVDFAPICYMHPNEIGFRTIATCAKCNDVDLRAELEPLSSKTIFDPSIKRIIFTAKQLTKSHLQIKIVDAASQREECPLEAAPGFPSENHEDADIAFGFVKAPAFSFRVIRRSTGDKIFDTSLGGFVYSDRFLQITTKLASENFYGLGEHEHASLKHDLNYKTWPIFARDQPKMGEGKPLSGAHPFYMVVEESGKAHGVYVKNSHPMEFSLIPNPGVIIRAIGGIFEINIYTGPTPENVVQQHTHYVGRSYLPPYWTLGFHFGRQGLGSTKQVFDLLYKSREARIPIDAYHWDREVMDQNRIFTRNQGSFGDLPDWMRKQRDEYGLRSVMVIDPAVTDNPPYEAWNSLSGNDALVKWPDGRVMQGHTYPSGNVGFVDFFNPNVDNVWRDLITRYSQDTPFDGIRLDMNEPSNFGSKDLNCPAEDDPPYRTALSGRLSDGSICMDARHAGGVRHFGRHNLYGLAESKSTYHGIVAAYQGKRPFVMSRSTFPGSGAYASHWLGDNEASWSHLRRSIISMLEMSMFGLAHTGANICGFHGAASPELCKRWYQTGAFYPLSRQFDAAGQNNDPATLKIQTNARLWIRARYLMIPYFYTLFYWANVRGDTVARPIFHEFPTDRNTWTIDTQFFIGPSVMLSPVLAEGAPNVMAYVPEGIWTAAPSKGRFEHCTPGSGKYVSFDAAEPTLFTRGGSVIPQQGEGSKAMTQYYIATKHLRSEPLSLSVIFDCQRKATGSLFWDDGESIDTIKSGNYLLVKYQAEYNDANGFLNIALEHSSADALSKAGNLVYNQFSFLLPKNPSAIDLKCDTCGGVQFDNAAYNTTTGKLVVKVKAGAVKITAPSVSINFRF